MQEDDFFPQLGTILVNNKQTLLNYINGLKRVGRIKVRIINSFVEDRIILEDVER